MDLSHLSDEELEKIANPSPHGTPSLDLSGMSDADLEHIANSAPKPQESLGRRLTRSAIDTVLPIGGAVGAGLLATPESAGLATVPASAAGYAGGKQLARIANHFVLGDELPNDGMMGMAKRTAGDLAEGALAETGGLIAGKAMEAAGPSIAGALGNLGSGIGRATEDLATAPMRSAGIANAGFPARAVNAVGKIGDAVGSIPFAGRAVGADVARMAPTIAQKTAIGANRLGEVLQASPQMFGKFAPVLQQAAQRGAQGLASTHFILQQTNPEYHSMVMKLSEQGDQ